MVNSNSKGNRSERKIVNWLDSHGWAVMRAPASGSATERELPDFIAGRSGFSLAAEVKASGGDPIYLSGEEVDALVRFARNFGADPRIAVDFDTEHGDPAYGEPRPGVYFFPVNKLYKTDGGNYRVKKGTALTDGVAETDL